jgi:hypothetical protein
MVPYTLCEPFTGLVCFTQLCISPHVEYEGLLLYPHHPLLASTHPPSAPVSSLSHPHRMHLQWPNPRRRRRWPCCCRFHWHSTHSYGCVHRWCCGFMHRQPAVIKQYLAKYSHPCDVLRRMHSPLLSTHAASE